MKTTVILLAGGIGARMGAGINKVLLPLLGKTVLRRSMEAFRGLADEMILVCHRSDMDLLRAEAALAEVDLPVFFTEGGKTRQASVLQGITFRSFAEDEILLIHDAARCLVSPEVIRRVIDSVRACGSGIPCIPASSTFKICDEAGLVLSTPERSSLREVQTPQGITAGCYLPLALRAAEEGFLGTDDASLLEHYGFPVQTVPGERTNLKLTTPEDLIMAESILQKEKPAPRMRVGMGYDVHRLVEGRKLILCGVEVPFEKGLLGHSDADVALHALMDAMLGACALGDIGRHFPDTDPAYEGASSLMLLRETVRILAEAGYQVSNADLTIVAQRPKLLPYIPRMVQQIAAVLGLPEDCVSVKATTTEKLGFEGRQEGISATAICAVTSL